MRVLMWLRRDAWEAGRDSELERTVRSWITERAPSRPSPTRGVMTDDELTVGVDESSSPLYTGTLRKEPSGAQLERWWKATGATGREAGGQVTLRTCSFAALLRSTATRGEGIGTLDKLAVTGLVSLAGSSLVYPSSTARGRNRAESSERRSHG